MQRDRRKLSAILAADVVGYSRLMAADEAGTLARLMQLRADVIEPKLVEFGGRIVGTAGDSLLMEFASVVEAAQCAMEIQARLTDLNAAIPQDRRMMFRMGLNLGDVIADHGTIYGEGVNLASRLEKLAEPGTICVSESVRDQIRSKLPWPLKSLGEVRVHNFPEPVRPYLLDPACSPVDAKPATSNSRSDERTSVMVLPFVNMSGDQDQGYFADGMTEDLITELSRFRHLSIASSNSSFSFKGRSVKASDVRRETGAAFLVEGSVRLVGRRVRISVQLIDAERDAHVWANRYDREFEDIFNVQDEVVRTIIEQLSYGLVEAAAQQRKRAPTSNLTAYDRFLHSLSAWRKGDERGAMSLALEAIAIDPEYSRALGDLAFYHAYMVFSGAPDLTDAQLIERVREFSRRAIAADKSDPYTLMAVAQALVLIGEAANARQYVETAASQNPNDLEIRNVMGQVLVCTGQTAAGLEMLEDVNRVAQAPTAGVRAALSDARFLHGDYKGALAALEAIVDPPPWMQMNKAPILALLGRMDEAQKALETAFSDKGRRLDAASYARISARVWARTEDRDRLYSGFRLLGVDV